MATSENWFGRRRGKHGVDLFKLDTKNKTPEQNIVDIIQGLYLKKPFQNDTSPSNKSFQTDYRPCLRGMQRNGSDSRRLSYLNALVTLLCKEDRNKLGFSTEELMTCIRISLVDDSMVIRAAALRVLRYLIQTESDVATFNNLRLPYLIIRSMEVMVRNEEERAQALRVVRRVAGAASGVAGAGAAQPEPALIRCLAALARDPTSLAREPAADRLSRPAAATLAEICVLHPELFVWCGGVGAVSRQLGECATPRMAEALCGVLLHALNEPSTRLDAHIDLLYLTAPYCDFHVRPPGTDSSRDEREMRFTCSRLALLCVLRSWPGLLHFCHPNFPGGLRALVAALNLPRLEVRKAILDLLYELVGLPQPEWTDEISVALGAVDPSDFQDSWRLNEGFVAAEGVAILPHLGATGPDIAEIHLALLLQCFLEAGLLESLAEVIVTSDTFISVRATVLVGQLVHLAHSYLPPQVWAGCGAVAALPALTRAAAAGRPQALAAVAALRALLGTLHARPAPATLFLDHVLLCCGSAFSSPHNTGEATTPALRPTPDELPPDRDTIEFFDLDKTEYKQRHSVGSRADVVNRNVSALVKSKSVSSRTSAAVSKVAKSAKLFNIFERDSDSLLRCTLVMQNKDGNTWDWEIIRTILKENDGTPYFNLNDSCHKAWAARIINYLKPSSNKYSHTDLSSTCNGHSATRAGCQLIRHLLNHNDSDSQRLLEDLFSDVSHQIEAIETGVKAHECLFSPQHMCNTMCQMYFLFIGQLCHSHDGLRMLKQTGLYDNLLELSTKTHHSCYVKLIISSLDYTIGSYPRDILTKTLTCNIQASRLYATQFLNVLLRASRKSHELLWRKTKSKKSFMHEHTQSDSRDDGDGDSFKDMETWILQLLVGQVKDESKAVVKVALGILEEASCVPALVEKLMPMRETLCQNCRLDKNMEPATLDFSAVGDKGYLLWLTLEVAAAQTTDTMSMAFIKKHLDFWTKSYNYRYARLVEAGTHDALALSEAGGGRSGARARRSARPPHHIHAALAQHYRARALLHPVLPNHYKILQHKKCTTEQEIADVKASLWAVGNTAVTGAGLQLLMSLSSGYLEDSILVHIVRLVKYNPVYSVRATAFYVLSLIGSTYDGANLLADLGWLCVRHTRHDQFPLTPDETLSLSDQSINCFVTSPDSRLNTYDAEMSEHSDHTDQSVAESSHSEHKYFSKVGSILEQSDQDVVDHKLSNIDGRRDHEKRKSHTLPIQGFSSSQDRPMLSESRTVDILRDCSGYDRPGSHRMPMGENRLLVGRMNSLDHTHEGRIRNTSESSTSGVSSCDSFIGKYAMPDRVLTLSPIPSSSSLYGMKGSSISQRPKIPDLQRRTSTSSYTGNDTTNSPPSHMDMTGYATIKSLNRRPHLSESAVTGSSELDDLSWLLSDPIRRSKPFSSLRDKSKSARERMSKLRLLEYDWKPLPQYERGRSSPLARRTDAPSGPARPRSRPPSAPGYIGICLPRDLTHVFPSDDEKKDNNVDKTAYSKRGHIPSFTADTSGASVDKSRTTSDGFKLGSKVSSAPKSSKADSNVAISGISSWKTMDTDHTEAGTIIASKMVTLSDTNVNALSGTNDTTVASEINASVAEESSIRTLTEENVTSRRDILTSEITASNKNKWHHAIGNCLACVRTRPPSAYELREAFFAGMDINIAYGLEGRSSTSSPTTVDRGVGCPQAELLRQVQLMANPIHLRQTRSVLLSLKQRHPEVFRSPCVYSDVCALLGRDTYMLCARRFLQELFLETCFDCFAAEPVAILARHGNVMSPTVTIPTDPRK